MADAGDLKSLAGYGVRVRVPPWLPWGSQGMAVDCTTLQFTAFLFVDSFICKPFPVCTAHRSAQLFLAVPRIRIDRLHHNDFQCETRGRPLAALMNLSAVSGPIESKVNDVVLLRAAQRRFGLCFL